MIAGAVTGDREIVIQVDALAADRSFFDPEEGGTVAIDGFGSGAWRASHFLRLRRNRMPQLVPLRGQDAPEKGESGDKSRALQIWPCGVLGLVTALADLAFLPLTPCGALGERAAPEEGESGDKSRALQIGESGGSGDEWHVLDESNGEWEDNYDNGSGSTEINKDAIEEQAHNRNTRT